MLLFPSLKNCKNRTKQKKNQADTNIKHRHDSLCAIPTKTDDSKKPQNCNWNMAINHHKTPAKQWQKWCEVNKGTRVECCSVSVNVSCCEKRVQGLLCMQNLPPRVSPRVFLATNLLFFRCRVCQGFWQIIADWLSVRKLSNQLVRLEALKKSFFLLQVSVERIKLKAGSIP